MSQVFFNEDFSEVVLSYSSGTLISQFLLYTLVFALLSGHWDAKFKSAIIA